MFSLTGSNSVTFSEIVKPKTVRGVPLGPTLFGSNEFSVLPTDAVAKVYSFYTSFDVPCNAFPVTIYQSTFPSPMVVESTPFVFSRGSVTFGGGSIPNFDSTLGGTDDPPPVPPTTPTPK